MLAQQHMSEAAVSAPKPVIHYTTVCRGRVEVLKLAMAYAGVDFDVVDLDYSIMKNDMDLYPFAQCPRYTDEHVELVQTNVIIRYLAQKHQLFGASDKERWAVEMVLEGAEALRAKVICYQYAEKGPDTKDKLWKDHYDPASRTSCTTGAHMAFLDHWLAKAGGQHMVGAGLTVADLALWEQVDMVLPLFPQQMKDTYPKLVEFHTRIAALPTIAAYLASPLRLKKATMSKNEEEL